eukprot:TRINITY_DN9359_c0_g2_i4.p1 TRINITY_DN9359_c0_g2~~TRINITY_DN9359_c0_g2_i4.p1  ORF type:complete len:178 (-),score=37.25 TRINITY_DN9359_c0_g2_i4:298-831(-)
MDSSAKQRTMTCRDGGSLIEEYVISWDSDNDDQEEGDEGDEGDDKQVVLSFSSSEEQPLNRTKTQKVFEVLTTTQKWNLNFPDNGRVENNLQVQKPTWEESKIFCVHFPSFAPPTLFDTSLECRFCLFWFTSQGERRPEHNSLPEPPHHGDGWKVISSSFFFVLLCHVIKPKNHSNY